MFPQARVDALGDGNALEPYSKAGRLVSTNCESASALEMPGSGLPSCRPFMGARLLVAVRSMENNQFTFGGWPEDLARTAERVEPQSALTVTCTGALDDRTPREDLKEMLPTTLQTLALPSVPLARAQVPATGVIRRPFAPLRRAIL